MKDFSLPVLRKEIQQSLPSAYAYTEQIDRALSLAYSAHEGQVRESANPTAKKIPYIVHPVGVAKIAAEMWVEKELTEEFVDVICAALTHDVLEDSSIDLFELSSQTSKSSADIVLSLTKPRLTSTITREQRNQAFLEQIINAGAAARYVKLCDILHNLSRPTMMPHSLLEKTIRKAKRSYPVLTKGQPYAERLSSRLEELIGNAEALANRLRSDNPKFNANDFDEFLSYCIKQSKGKVLEEHDIQEIIEAIPGIILCAVVGFPAFVEETLQPLCANHDDLLERLNINKRIEAAEIPLTPPLFDRSAVGKVGIDRVLLAPLSSVADWKDTRFVFAGIKNRSVPTWLTSRTLLAVTNILAERLHGRENRELAEYAEALNHFGLSLDPRLAQKHGLTQARMLMIKNQLETGHFVLRNLLSALEFMTRSADMDNVVDRTESRVKTATSILEKIHARKLMDASEIDDLVGIRMIFVSKKTRDRFTSTFQSDLSNPNGELLSMAQVIKDTVNVEESTSSSGYRAVHIRFYAKAPMASRYDVPCEIQLRTVFEDAWARLSHITSYKKQFFPAKKQLALLKDLAKLRDQCEDRISLDL